MGSADILEGETTVAETNMERATSEETVQGREKVSLGPRRTEEKEPTALEVLACLSKNIGKLSNRPDSRTGQKLPKWTDKQDPERFFTLFELVMDNYDISSQDWLKQLANSTGQSPDSVWAELPSADRKVYRQVKKRLLTQLGLGSSERCRHWWGTSP